MHAPPLTVRLAPPTAPISRPTVLGGFAPSRHRKLNFDWGAWNRCAEAGVSFEEYLSVGPAMQFMVYLTVLMVSVSTVLLEIHWLTTPPPQPKSAVQASAPPRPKVEGPGAALSPVYPKRLEPAQPTPPGSDAAAKTEAAQKPSAETTGVSTRFDDGRRSA